MNRLRRALTQQLAAGAVAGMAPWSLRAADKPPCKILVGYPPGGSSDVLARNLAEQLVPLLGRAVIVENKVGAGGRIAAEVLAKGPADGSVWMVAPNGLTSIQTITYRSELRYDPAKDFAPVAKLVNSDHALAVSKSIGVNTARELQAWLKANVDRGNFGSPAIGGMPHFAGLVAAKAMGQTLNHVAYKGGAPVAMALIGNEVPVGVSAISDFAAHDKAGKLKIIGLMGSKRSGLSPELPTLLEQGFDVRAPGWTGLWTRAGTAPGAVDEMAAAVQKVMQTPAFRKSMTTLLSEPDFEAGAGLMKLQQQEWDYWTPIIKASGFKPE